MQHTAQLVIGQQRLIPHVICIEETLTSIYMPRKERVSILIHDNIFLVRAWRQVDFKAPLPCLSTVAVDVTIDRTDKRKYFVSARLQSLDHTVLYATAEALFVKPRSKEKEE